MASHVMYIFVNSDLQMSKGQVIAQCCHITQIITEELVMKCYETVPISQECINYMKWKSNPTTIILRATAKELEILKSRGRYFTDSGNRIPDNSLTVVGFYPCLPDNDVTKDYKLF
jgi:peptidyl-tRNA hydrolase